MDKDKQSDSNILTEPKTKISIHRMSKILLFEVDQAEQLEKMDNLRLVWEFFDAGCFMPLASYPEKVSIQVLKRLAPIYEDYRYMIWGWKTKGDPIIYKYDLYNE